MMGLAGQGFVQVDGRLLVQVGAFGEPGLEACGDFRTDFEAAVRDGRSDGENRGGGVCGKICPHFVQGGGKNAVDGAAPAGVNDGYGVVVGVGEDKGDAIGGSDSDPSIRMGGVQGVTLAEEPGFRFDSFYYCGVNLLEFGRGLVGDPIVVNARTETVIKPAKRVEQGRPVELVWGAVDHAA